MEIDPSTYTTDHYNNSYRMVLTPFKQKWCNIAGDYKDWFCIAYTELWEVGFNAGTFVAGPPMAYTAT
jgi:hypothetical protein